MPSNGAWGIVYDPCLDKRKPKKQHLPTYALYIPDVKADPVKTQDPRTKNEESNFIPKQLLVSNFTQPQINLDSFPSSCLVVTNLHPSLTPHDIKALFMLYGAVTRVHLEFDPKTNQSIGVALVQFGDGNLNKLDNSESIKRALQLSQGRQVEGQTISVSQELDSDSFPQAVRAYFDKLYIKKTPTSRPSTSNVTPCFSPVGNGSPIELKPKQLDINPHHPIKPMNFVLISRDCIPRTLATIEQIAGIVRPFHPHSVHWEDQGYIVAFTNARDMHQCCKVKSQSIFMGRYLSFNQIPYSQVKYPQPDSNTYLFKPNNNNDKKSYNQQSSTNSSSFGRILRQLQAELVQLVSKDITNKVITPYPSEYMEKVYQPTIQKEPSPPVSALPDIPTLSFQHNPLSVSSLPKIKKVKTSGTTTRSNLSQSYRDSSSISKKSSTNRHEGRHLNDGLSDSESRSSEESSEFYRTRLGPFSSEKGSSRTPSPVPIKTNLKGTYSRSDLLLNKTASPQRAKVTRPLTSSPSRASKAPKLPNKQHIHDGLSSDSEENKDSELEEGEEKDDSDYYEDENESFTSSKKSTSRTKPQTSKAMDPISALKKGAKRTEKSPAPQKRDSVKTIARSKSQMSNRSGTSSQVHDNTAQEEPIFDENIDALLPEHKTGSARTEGIYKVSAELKKLRIRPTLRAIPQHVSKVSSRMNRANNRRQLSHLNHFMEKNNASSDLLNSNQLQVRRKQLQFASSGIHDLGLFSMEFIPANDLVIEYIGEVIRQKVADLREKEYEARGIGSSYLFRIDDDNVIDATVMGNMARFINHSCIPNCNAKVITVEGKKKIVIYAKRDIQPMEEITYDYKFPIEDDKIKCLCNHEKCRGYLN